VPPSYKTHNVAAEMKDPNSVLSFYRQLLTLRHKEPALLDGDYTSINEDDPNVLGYLRRYKDEAFLVLALTSFHKPLSGATDALPMEAYSVLIAKITK